MEENPSRVACKKLPQQEVSSKNGREMVECTAAVIADCVAICCCPCAVFNLLTLAFVKVPWKIGRRCLRRRKNKVGKLETKRNCMELDTNSFDRCLALERSEHLRLKEGRKLDDSLVFEIESAFAFGKEVDIESEGHNGMNAACFEADRVWLELYQVGQLGFGRVSFTGLPFPSSQGKAS